MRKITLFSVSKMLVMLFAALLLLSADAFAATVSMPTVAGDAGSTVDIPVNIDDATDIAGYQFTVTYDPSALDCTGAFKGSLTGGFDAPTNNMTSGRFVTLSLDPNLLELTGGSGSLAIIRCTVTGSPGATTPLHFTPVPDTVLSNGVGDSVPAVLADGAFTVTVNGALPPAAPVVSGTTPSRGGVPGWTWASGGRGNGTFRYKLDDSDLTTGATVTRATTYTPLSALARGGHTLYVQEMDDAGHWSLPASAFAFEADALFSDAPVSKELDMLRTGEVKPWRVRSRNVVVDFSKIVNKGVPQDKVILNLFDDVTFTVVKVRFETTPRGYVWTGHVRRDKDLSLGEVTVYSEDGNTLMSINIWVQYPFRRAYGIEYLGKGVHVVSEGDPQAFPKESPNDFIVPPQQLDASEGSMLLPEGAFPDDGSTIDVMVVYTAAAAVGGNIAAEIDAAVNSTNASYANSGITPRLRLVYKAQVNYTETGNLYSDLNQLTYNDEVRDLRNLYGADMVSLWVANGGGLCGLGYQMETVSTSFNLYAFHVTKRSCNAGETNQYSFAHEFGHIQGARHDWAADPLVTPFPYSHGYVLNQPPLAVRTIMAYSDVCRRIQYWSNPDVYYSGYPLGVPEWLYHPADNRKTLNNTAYTVANFRAGPCPYMGDLNDDRYVNLLDVVKIKRIATGADPIQSCSDMNLDGVWNLFDVVKVKRVATGKDPMTCCL